MIGDRLGDGVVGLGQADQQGARRGVVEAEALALERRAGGADRLLGGDLLQRHDAERGRHQQLADVVQQAGEVGGVAVGAAQLGGRVGVGGDRDGVDVQLAAAQVRAAREALEEAVGGGLQRDPDERPATEQRDRLADRARADRAGVGGGVRVAQQVGGERLVGLDHRDEVARRRRSGRRRACGRGPPCHRARAGARSAGGRRARACRAWKGASANVIGSPADAHERPLTGRFSVCWARCRGRGPPGDGRSAPRPRRPGRCVCRSRYPMRPRTIARSRACPP